jgi:hypothetical protein
MRALLLLALLGGVAHAQNSDTDDVSLAAKDFEPSMCAQLPDEEEASASIATNMTPTTWTTFEVTGKFIDGGKTVRALLEPTMRRHSGFTNALRDEIRRSAKAFGYHVVGIGLRDTQVVIHVEPLPIVRIVDVDPGVPWYGALFTRLLHDDVRRRMRVRTGSYLPWDPIRRRCEIEREKERVVEYPPTTASRSR